MQGETINWRPALETDEHTQRFYANYAEVNVTAFEMVFTFAVIPARHNVAEMEQMKSTGVVKITSNAQVTIPINFLSTFMDVVAGAKKIYEDQWEPVLPWTNKKKSHE
jgi:hypothetical protein